MKINIGNSFTQLEKDEGYRKFFNDKKISLDEDYHPKYTKVWQRARSKLKFKLFLSKIVKGAFSQEQKKLDFRQYTNIPAGKRLDFIIKPEGKFKLIWNIIMSLVILDTAILMPFTTAFFEVKSIGPFEIKDFLIDFLFFFNFLINLYTAYYENRSLPSNKKILLLKSFKNGLIFDLVCSFPFNILITLAAHDSESSSNIIRIIRVSKLFKILRLSRIFKVFEFSKSSKLTKNIQIFIKVRQSVFKLGLSIAKILISVHIFACFWYLTSKIDDFGPDTWVSRYNFIDEEIPTLYIASLYWAIIVISTVGYGDISAYTILEKNLSILWMIFSLYIYGFIIGSLITLVKNSNNKEQDLYKKIEFIDLLASDNKIPRDIASKIKKNLRALDKLSRCTWKDKEKILDELPKKLRYKVALAMYGGAANKLNFFKQKDTSLVAKIIPLLSPCVINPCECIYEKGHNADELYFVLQGQLVYMHKIFLVLTINKYQYFGDIELISESPRLYTAKSLTHLDLLTMSKSVLSKIKKDYHQIWEEIQDKAIQTESKILKTLKKLQKSSSTKQDSIQPKPKNLKITDLGQLLTKISKLTNLGRSFKTHLKSINKTAAFLKASKKRSKSV